MGNFGQSMPQAERTQLPQSQSGQMIANSLQNVSQVAQQFDQKQREQEAQQKQIALYHDKLATDEAKIKLDDVLTTEMSDQIVSIKDQVSKGVISAEEGKTQLQTWSKTKYDEFAPTLPMHSKHELSEQTHILIPGGQKLFVGTPHTHDSLYTHIQKLGAKCLVLKMFEHEKRFENVSEAIVDFDPVYIFSGIGNQAKLLKEGINYKWVQQGKAYKIIFTEQHYLIDVYSEALWPERFTPAVMEERRKECRTINEWDSQYQLHAKPTGDVRLDPEKLIAYDCEPILRRANGRYIMMLGERQIVGMTCRWDPSSGKLKSDVSAVTLVLHDDLGNKYWHRSIALKGEVIITDDFGEVTGGQVWQLCDLIEEYSIPSVTIETNGIGNFAPASLKAALKRRKIRCGVNEHHSTGQKNKRILDGIEGPLVSGLLWAHVSVLDTHEGENTSVQFKQMRMFNPAITDQEDDYLDSLAGAITDSPERIGKIHRQNEANASPNWRTDGGVIEATLDFEY